MNDRGPWRRAVLGSVIRPRREKVLPATEPSTPYVGMAHVEAHSTRILEISSGHGMRSAANRFYSSDVLYGRLRPYLNKVCKPGFSGFCSAEFMVFPETEEVRSDFLKYRLNATDFVQFTSHLNAGDRPRVDFDQISSFEMFLPPPDEQQRIVAEIEKQFTRLETGMASLKRVQTALKRYRASVLKAACEGQFPHEPLSVAIQSLDQGWSPKCEPLPSPSGDVWAVIKTSAIQHGRFVAEENKRLPTALRPRPHLELQPGDLLITRAGPRARAGVACLVKSTRPRLMLCDKAYRVRTKHEIADPAFLEIVLNAPHIVDAVDELKTGISDSGVNLTQRGFQELVIPLPSLSEQQRIVADVERRLSLIDELEAVTSTELRRSVRLRQSILQQAFRGEATNGL